MPKHVIKSDRNIPWIVNKDGHTWILEKQAAITVASGDAVVIDTGFDDNRLKLFGDIVASGSSASAIAVDGDGTTIRLGGKASLGAEMAISGTGDNTRVVNDGTISGDTVGIAQNAHFSAVNHGKISGGYGISVAQADKILNAGDGVISGTSAGILLFGDEDSMIVNKGRITSTIGAAITDGDGNVTIRNTGRIVGDVVLGNGHNLFDTRGGTVAGIVAGGDGHDTYYVSNVDIQIVEAAGGEKDSLFSSVSIMLPDNVEFLGLLGRKNIDGTGGSGDNRLTGNRGDNTLSGLGGADRLAGGAGRDRLSGDAGADGFIFQKKSDDEIVLDFEDGTDKVLYYSQDFDDAADFLSRSSQHGEDIWIEAGGTRMILRDMQISHFTQDDIGPVTLI